MRGSTIISAATGVPDRKETSHGTQEGVWSRHARQGLARRQGRLRAENLPEHWHSSVRRRGANARKSDGRGPASPRLRCTARSYLRAGCGKVCAENQHKRSLADDVSRLKGLMPWIGVVTLDRLHVGALQPWITERRRSGASVGTINHGLQIVRHILNLAAGEWMDEQGLTWLHAPPKIKLLANHDKRQPYPLSWEEQSHLFRELPAHLREMALFAVNTGCRDAEICNLEWEWEVAVPELGTSVFIIPGVAGQKRLRPSGRAQPDSQIRGRCQARTTWEIRVRLQGRANRAHVEQCLEEGEDARWA